MPKEKINFVLQIFIKAKPTLNDIDIVRLLISNTEINKIILFKTDEEVLEYDDDNIVKAFNNYYNEVQGNGWSLRFLDKKDNEVVSYQLDKISYFSRLNIPNPDILKWQTTLNSDIILRSGSIISSTLHLRLWKNSWFAQTSTNKELDKRLAKLGIPEVTYPIFGFNLYHWFIIPPQNINSKDYPSHFENNEVFLQAPVYEAKALPSGATLIKLCKDFIWDKVDEEYIENWIKLYYFLMEHKIK